MPLFYRLRGKKLLLERLADPWPFNNQFWPNAALGGGENAHQQDLSAAVLNTWGGWTRNCSTVARCRLEVQAAAWVWPQRAGPAPVLALLIRWALGEGCRRKVPGCRRQKVPVAAGPREEMSHPVRAVLQHEQFLLCYTGQTSRHPSSLEQPLVRRASPCHLLHGQAGHCSSVPPVEAAAGSSLPPVISSLRLLQGFGKGRSKDSGSLFLLYFRVLN